MFKIITIGDALIDTHLAIDDATVNCDINHEHCHLCLDYAAKVPITGSFQCLGGNAANVACGTARLGLKTAILSTIGRDATARLVKSELKKNRVNTGLLFGDKKCATRYSVVLNFKGERTILSYHSARAYRWPLRFAPTEYVYYTGMSEGYEPLQEKLFSHLQKNAATKLVFNPGSYQLKYTMAKVKEAVAKSDIVIVNVQEAEQIVGATVREQKSVATLIHGLLALGAREVAITDAAQGAWAGDLDHIWHIDSFPVPVVAKTGAGDAFSAGYTVARALGHDIPTALRWGIADSSGVIGQMGAQTGLLDQVGIKNMISKHSKVEPVEV